VTVGTGYTVRIVDKGGQYSDNSDARFPFWGNDTDLAQRRQIWKSGETMPVTWNSTGVSANVKLILIKDGIKVGNIVTDIR